MLHFYNSLTRKKEYFKPINSNSVGVYTCGPTVYNFVSIGNWRTYVLGDLVIRILRYSGYKVDYVMNITDVGHLTGDNLGDASIGEDRQEKAARRENKSVWEVARFYTDDFITGYKKLNLTLPKIFCKATDHIQEQICLIGEIERKGFTYKTTDGIYFDTKAYEKAGNVYPALSTLDKIKEGARVDVNPDKKDPRDFALWKFSYPDGRSFDFAQDDAASRRQMEWESPWGIGFPGWHIECSAMSMKYLGNFFKRNRFYGEQSRTIDIHIGGEDLRSIHHPNEILQSEAATGKKPFVKYWLHGAFLTVDGGRMGKSLGNTYTLQDLEKKGFSPMALRYFYFTGHYRKQLNFTWEALEGAHKSWEKLREKVSLLSAQINLPNNANSPNKPDFSYEKQFREYLGDDLNMPKILSLIWEILKDKELPDSEKHKLILGWDRVLGLELGKAGKARLPASPQGEPDGQAAKAEEVDKSIKKLIKDREELRKQKKFTEADKIRKEIKAQGYSIEDTAYGTTVKPKPIQ